MRFVQYGCGHSGPAGWLNYDASLTLRLERLPLLGQFIKKNTQRFPDSIQFGDIVRGLPIEDNSVDGAYASHVLEHLSREEMFTALERTFRMLKPGGVFRLIVPDLEARARRYIGDLDTARSDANDRLLRVSYLGTEANPRGPAQIASEFLGRNKHLWMWDYPSMKAALESAGFTGVRRCDLGDSNIVQFDAVEQRDRFYDDEEGIRELAVHCEKPA